jgi:hypothetical protein
MSDGEERRGGLVTWVDKKRREHDVPTNVKRLLEKPFRGQKFGDDLLFLMSHFVDEPVFVEKSTITRSPASSMQVRSIIYFFLSFVIRDRSIQVKTRLTLKDDATFRPREFSCGSINATRLLGPILKSKISDESKAKLCRRLRSAEAKKWLSKYDADVADRADQAPAAVALVEAQEASKTDAEKTHDARLGTLAGFGFQACSTAQAAALMFFVSRFFFLCLVPFSVVEHWSFRSMIGALAPAFVVKMTKRNALSRTWLPRILEETKEKVAKYLATKRKKTVVIDGFKDRRNVPAVLMRTSTRLPHLPLYLLLNAFQLVNYHHPPPFLHHDLLHAAKAPLDGPS